MRIIKSKTFALVIGIAVVLSIPMAIASAHGTLDQFFDSTADLNFGVSASHHAPIGQEFTPTTSSVASVDVYMGGANSHIGPGQDVAINLRESSITGTLLGSSAPVYVGSTDPGSFVHFDFPSDVSVTPGSVYVLEVSISNPHVTWLDGVARENATYAGGSAILFGSISPNRDFLFRTYSGPGTKRDVLTGSGSEIDNHGVNNAPGLDKPFNEKSKASENAGKKK